MYSLDHGVIVLKTINRWLFFRRLEDELAQRRSLSDAMHDDELKGSRRGSASARRSFFRRKKHQRNNSKDSRELSSFSDQSINSDSTPFLDGKLLFK